jgi:antitoxin VapB
MELDFVMPSARAKLFTNGGSQALRLPKEYRFEGSEVLLRREGGRVIIEEIPPKGGGWARLKTAIAGFSPDFMADGRGQPDQPDARPFDP